MRLLSFLVFHLPATQRPESADEDAGYSQIQRTETRLGGEHKTPNEIRYPQVTSFLDVVDFMKLNGENFTAMADLTGAFDAVDEASRAADPGSPGTRGQGQTSAAGAKRAQTQHDQGQSRNKI